MCQSNADPGYVRLMLCPHGTYFLSIGHATLHLNEEELSLVGQAIHEMASRHPTLFAKLAVHLVERHFNDACG